MKTISEIMTTSPESCGKNSTLQEVANQMKKSNIGSLPVIDENKKVVGMVTDRDIVLAIAKNNKPASELKVTDVMSSTIHTINPEADANAALQLMRTKQIGRLPVVDSEKRLKGIVTLNGIVRKFQGSTDETEIHYKGKENVINTLQAIAERDQVAEPIKG